MAKELIELGRAKAKGGRSRLRVCYKVRKVKGGYAVATYDRKTKKLRNWVAAPCLRVKSKRRALVSPTRRGAESIARKCGFRCRA